MPADTPPHDVVGRVLTQRHRAATRPTPPGEEVEPPIHWPSLAPLVAQREWTKLAEWVDELRARYRGLDSYVVPACWFEHESLVVALQALRDHERVAYARGAPGSAGTDWHRALRDITAMMRQFTADLRCGHAAEYADGELFDKYVAEDLARRRRRAATVALGESEQ